MLELFSNGHGSYTVALQLGPSVISVMAIMTVVMVLRLPRGYDGLRKRQSLLPLGGMHCMYLFLTPEPFQKLVSQLNALFIVVILKKYYNSAFMRGNSLK